MEGVASNDEHMFIVGSHSMRRKDVKANLPYEKNRIRQVGVEPHSESYRLFRFKLDEDGKLKAERSITLERLLKNDEILKPFCKIPSKENGVDIEGIAVKENRLFLGLRGPVLRGNYAPVLSFAFADDVTEYDLQFVELGGRGIRDLAAVDDGFLLLAGPVGDGDGTYELYFWNGADCIPGNGAPGGKVTKLGDVRLESYGKPEDIAVAGETDERWERTLVCDGDSTASTIMARKL